MSDDAFIPAGKLPSAMLGRLLKKYAGRPGPQAGLVVGPGIGVDAAVIDAGGPGYVIAKTDPITFVAEDIGGWALDINANDVACMGGTPKWFLAAVILPAMDATEELAESVFRDISGACGRLGVSLVGGHTEITHGLDRPIVVGHMLGTVNKDRLITSAGARPGDSIILTKGIAVEAVSIIAREKKAELAGRYDPEFIARCRDYYATPGISVVKDAKLAMDSGEVHCLHDPTEGGLSSGLYEIAEAAGVGIEVDAAAIRVLPEAYELLSRFRLDPLGVIASGALLITLPPDDAGKVISALEAGGIAACVIGRVTEKSAGVKLVRGGVSSDMPVFAKDEITKLF